MKNMRIEKVLKQWNEGNFELEISHAEARWCRAYNDSVEKGLDEIVIGFHDCVHESEVAELIEAARTLKIEYFVFAGTFSGAFEVVNEMVINGARVGKFVVKEYTENRFGEEEVIKVPGMRINL